MRPSAFICAVLFILPVAAGCSKSASQSSAAAGSPAGSPPAMASSHGASAANAPDAGEMKIADIWAQRTSLAGKRVTVTGKVVKYNGAILDRNWLHIQDGSGSATDGSNDLAVTTTDEANVGDTVTVTGVVGIDRDFTAGYQYPVMLEQGTVKRK